MPSDNPFSIQRVSGEICRERADLIELGHQKTNEDTIIESETISEGRALKVIYHIYT